MSEQFDDCGCCEGIRKLTPIRIWNQPGLTAIKYRVGTHTQFKKSMLASLSTILKNLSTREDDDLAIAILDAWATIADVLTFYQERIANEGFLRTATERRSVLELARSIGYELRPAVAASTYLAFTIDESVEETKIDVGTKVQSLPEERQMPQIFETVEEIIAKSEWNELKPNTIKEQKLTEALQNNKFVFKGIGKRFNIGDLLLIITQENGEVEYNFRIISNVEEDNVLQQTQVDVDDVKPVDANPIISSIIFKPVTTSEIETAFIWLPSILTAKELKELSVIKGISTKELFTVSNIIKKLQFLPKSKESEEVEFATGVYVFRVKSGIFGHNAPKYDVLPDGTRKEWNSESINKNSNGNLHNSQGNLIYLDNVYSSILPNSIAILQSSDRKETRIYQIGSIIEKSIADYSLSAKVTGLELKNADSDDLSEFSMRETTVYAESEFLELAELHDDSPIEGNEVTLSESIDLPVGRLISITGEPIDKPGVMQSEIAEINEVIHDIERSLTKIVIHRFSNTKYNRDTVTINANVVYATHGKTTTEVLGNGDPSKRQQQFILKETPLTYTIAPTSSGSKSTLNVRVDNILWKEVPSLYNLTSKDQAYTVRIDDDGSVRVIFGNGIRGMRPPAGRENIVAEYRVGSGASGMLKANQLTLLMSRPLGVRGVTNPVESTGAVEPEELEDARTNAPLQVLTMDRIVSLKDFESFARAFSGIGKAQAVWIWHGEKKIVRLTIASPSGDNIDEDSPTYKALKEAIDLSKDPLIAMRIEPFEKRLFNVEAKIAVSPDRRFEDVKLAVENALYEEFSFNSRQFDQPVMKSEVMAVIQNVDGVVAVDIDYLYTVGSEDQMPEERSLNDILPKTIEKDNAKAWMLFISPVGVKIKEMKV